MTILYTLTSLFCDENDSTPLKNTDGRPRKIRPNFLDDMSSAILPERHGQSEVSSDQGNVHAIERRDVNRLIDTEFLTCKSHRQLLERRIFRPHQVTDVPYKKIRHAAQPLTGCLV